jgi:hypothetical protein
VTPVIRDLVAKKEKLILRQDTSSKEASDETPPFIKGLLKKNRHSQHSDPNLLNCPDLVSLGPTDSVKAV